MADVAADLVRFDPGRRTQADVAVPERVKPKIPRDFRILLSPVALYPVDFVADVHGHLGVTVQGALFAQAVG